MFWTPLAPNSDGLFSERLESQKLWASAFLLGPCDIKVWAQLEHVEKMPRTGWNQGLPARILAGLPKFLAHFGRATWVPS